MFVRYRGKTKIMYFKKGDTLVEVRAGGLVIATDSGTISPPNNDSTDRIWGVCRVNDTITDTVFNSDGAHGGCPVGFVPVEVPVENAVEWLIDVDSDAGAADTDIGQYRGVDTEGGASVNAGDSAGCRVDISDTTKLVLITGRQSASKVIGCLGNTIWQRPTTDTATGV